MGIDMTFEKAYAKASIAAGNKLPEAGSGVFISVRDEDKEAIIPVAEGLHKLGYKILSTSGTGAAIQKANVPCEMIFKISEGRPNARTFPLFHDLSGKCYMVKTCYGLLFFSTLCFQFLHR